MKRISILILGLMILGVSACRKVTNEYYTTPNQTIYTTVQANDWVKSTVDGNETYSAKIPFYDTDIYQNDFDGVLVYLMFENNTYDPIPQTYDGFSYSYKVTNQEIVLRIQNSSGSGTIFPPDTPLKAKIVMVVSEE